MKKIRFFVLVFILTLTLFLIQSVLAGAYTIEFNQIQNSVIVKEEFPDNQTKYYNEPEILDISGNNIYFLKKITFFEDYSEVRVRINLDERVVVNQNQIFPAGYSFESDGKTISIVWNLNDVKSSQIFTIFAELKDTSKDFSFYFALILGVLLAIAVFYFILDRLIFKKKKQIEKNKIQQKIGQAPVVTTSESKNKVIQEREKYEYLLETEKKVIDALKQTERNELWQKQIQNLTGFSKAKVSRLINNLEQRNLVRKINFGNTNKIRLK